MKFFYIIALLVPVILAADGMAVTSKPDAIKLQQLIKKTCTDLPPQCVEGLARLINGVEKRRPGGNKECRAKIASCAKKVGPLIAAGTDGSAPM
ncbi:hypothetical protein FQN49_007756 [Arthroderma sp. PD_2]|nr:hypothetical protein FQN49_007756 [Arthroderma sp. PD_2]